MFGAKKLERFDWAGYGKGGDQSEDGMMNCFLALVSCSVFGEE